METVAEFVSMPSKIWIIHNFFQVNFSLNNSAQDRFGILHHRGKKNSQTASTKITFVFFSSQKPNKIDTITVDWAGDTCATPPGNKTCSIRTKSKSHPCTQGVFDDALSGYVAYANKYRFDSFNGNLRSQWSLTQQKSCKLNNSVWIVRVVEHWKHSTFEWREKIFIILYSILFRTTYENNN